MNALLAFLPPWLSVPLVVIGRALRAVPWRVWALLALCALAWWAVDRYGDRRAVEAANAVQARWDAENAAEALAAAQSADKARKIEERHRADLAAAAERFLADQRKADEKHDTTLAALRAGTLRLRERFSCPRVPGAATHPAGADAEGPRGFGTEDAATALGIARDGDRAAEQLNALIDALRAEGR